MFTDRSLSPELDAVRAEHAPDALVFDADTDFETLPPAQAEELGLVVDELNPAGAPEEWLPPDAPELLDRYAGGEFTIGLPGDGGVTWTRQTSPPVVLVKPRLSGAPETFVDFLVAEALVEVGLGEPEQFLAFFGPSYREFADAGRGFLDPAGTYQVAAACYDASVGLATREVFAGWEDTRPDLHAAWIDAGERLQSRLGELSEAMATGRTGFSDAAELACGAIKHGQHAGEIPAPFDALDAATYREHGPAYAVEWIERAAEALG